EGVVKRGVAAQRDVAAAAVGVQGVAAVAPRPGVDDVAGDVLAVLEGGALLAERVDATAVVGDLEVVGNLVEEDLVALAGGRGVVDLPLLERAAGAPREAACVGHPPTPADRDSRVGQVGQ